MKKRPIETNQTKTNQTKTNQPKVKEVVNYKDKSINVSTNGNSKNIPLNNKQMAEILYGKKLNIKCKNKKQKDLINTIEEKEITIAVGPSGTGKSHLSVAMALKLLADPNNNYQKIYIITPNVEVDGSELGFLPGPLADKLSVYLFSTYYLMDKIIGKSNREKLVELDIISPLAIGYIRGINIDQSLLIGEELQNTTTLQFKTLITRIGFSSKFILSGDLEQVDIRNNTNGLQDSINKFSDFDEIGIIKFEKNDIVRNPLIGKILDKY